MSDAVRQLIRNLALALMNLTDEELEIVAMAAAYPAIGRAPEFAGWIRRMTGVERERRAGTGDVAFPEVDFTKWTDSETADSLVASLVLAETFLSGRILDFALALMKFTTGAAATALQYRQIVQSN